MKKIDTSVDFVDKTRNVNGTDADSCKEVQSRGKW